MKLPESTSLRNKQNLRQNETQVALYPGPAENDIARTLTARGCGE